MYIYRMVMCAHALDNDILACLAQNVMLNTFAFDNKFFPWHGRRFGEAHVEARPT